jgi:putative heme iron utilization protein
MTRHDAPASGAQRQDLLYDPTVPTPSHAEYARTLASRVPVGTLCTLVAGDPPGYPYGSFVTFALDDGNPVFLISSLAEHTRNLVADPRASLLVVEPGEGDPLARGRVTLLGPCTRLQDATAKARARDAFCAAHPDSAYYLDFGDFALFSLHVTALRYIGGYGRMSWVSSKDWHAATPDPLAAHVGGILEHMNTDHADTLALYCRVLSRATDTSAAVMTGVDRYGFEMSATTAAGPRPIRLGFSHPVSTPEGVRKEMVALAKRARAAGGPEGSAAPPAHD